jgi:hypothetical protein
MSRLQRAVQRFLSPSLQVPTVIAANQCCEYMTFWNGSRSGSCCFFVIDIQDANKKLPNFLKIPLLIPF